MNTISTEPPSLRDQGIPDWWKFEDLNGDRYEIEPEMVYAMFSRRYTGLSVSDLRKNLANANQFEREALQYACLTFAGMHKYGV